MKVKVTIERSADLFCAYAEKIDGVLGSGETIEEAKASIEKSIALLKKYNKKDKVPKALTGDYELVYKFDTESFFKYYI